MSTLPAVMRTACSKVVALCFSACAAVPCAAQSACQITKLVPADGESNQAFGISAAIHGDLCVVGAPWINQTFPTKVGMAYVYERSGGSWLPAGVLHEPGPKVFTGFGRTLGIHDGLIVGGVPLNHSVCGYVREASDWKLVFETQAVGWYPTDYFGYDGFAFDGARIIVGAIADKTKGGFAGAAYIFRVDGETCVQEAKLVASDGSAGDEFGISAAIDGDRAIVGAWDDDPVGLWNSGSAYVFERMETGQWVEVAKLVPSDPKTLDGFGRSVAIQGDEGYVGSIRGQGAVYVFRRDPFGAWLQAQKLGWLPGGSSGSMGMSLAVDGAILAAGAYQADTPSMSAGAVVLFEPQASRNWAEVGIVFAHDGSPYDELGRNVSLDGNTLLCGVYKDAPNGPFSGSAYLFAVGPDANSNGLMDPCECPGDVNKDWIVDQADLGLLLANWGCTGGLGYEPSTKPCPGALTACCGDLDADGDVDQADLGVMLQNFGNVCP